MLERAGCSPNLAMKSVLAKSLVRQSSVGMAVRVLIDIELRRSPAKVIFAEAGFGVLVVMKLRFLNTLTLIAPASQSPVRFEQDCYTT